jgi:hypothetical protein
MNAYIGQLLVLQQYIISKLDQIRIFVIAAYKVMHWYQVNFQLIQHYGINKPKWLSVTFRNQLFNAHEESLVGNQRFLTLSVSYFQIQVYKHFCYIYFSRLCHVN